MCLICVSSIKHLSHMGLKAFLLSYRVVITIWVSLRQNFAHFCHLGPSNSWGNVCRGHMLNKYVFIFTVDDVIGRITWRHCCHMKPILTHSMASTSKNMCHTQQIMIHHCPLTDIILACYLVSWTQSMSDGRSKEEQPGSHGCLT